MEEFEVIFHLNPRAITTPPWVIRDLLYSVLSFVIFVLISFIFISHFFLPYLLQHFLHEMVMITDEFLGGTLLYR